MNLSGVASSLFLGALFAVFLAVALVTENEPERQDPRSFYFEARVEAPEGSNDDVLGGVKGWYERPGRWRYEFSSSEPDRAHESVIQVSDGEQYRLYQGVTNTYSVGDTRKYMSGFGLTERDAPPPPSFGLFLGPPLLGDAEAYLQALVKAGNITLSERTGERMIAGRRADRFDMRGQDGRMSSVWVDHDYDFILRFEVPYAPSLPADDEPGTLEAEVLALEFNGDIDDSVFAFEPPPGAREIAPDDGVSVGSGSSGRLGEGVPPPEGFMSVTYVPEGYEATGYEEAANSRGVYRYGVTYERPNGGGVLRVEQTVRAGGLAESQRVGEEVDVGESTGFLKGDGPVFRLTWARDDLVVELTGIGLKRDELFGVAESMRP